MRSVLAACAALAIGLSLPGIAKAGLVDQRGAAFALERNRGPYVVTFIATRCTDSCPVANAVFSAALARAAKQRVPATFVTVTLDPKYDTPFVMARYAGRFDADPARWRFVSGSPSDVEALMRRFGVAAHGGEHSSFVYLVDAKRPTRNLLLSADAPARIVDLLEERMK